MPLDPPPPLPAPPSPPPPPLLHPPALLPPTSPPPPPPPPRRAAPTRCGPAAPRCRARPSTLAAGQEAAAELAHLHVVAHVQGERADVAEPRLQRVVAEGRARAADLEGLRRRLERRALGEVHGHQRLRLGRAPVAGVPAGGRREHARCGRRGRARPARPAPPARGRCRACRGARAPSRAAKSSAARATPTWLAAKPSVNVRGSLRTQAPGSPTIGVRPARRGPRCGRPRRPSGACP